MSIHEKYYGQAIREAESGVRRDDIWAKAFAEAGGDPIRSKALYIQLVAHHLSAAAASFDREERRRAVADAALQAGGVIAKTGSRAAYIFFILVVWALLSLVLLGILGKRTEGLYKTFVQERAIGLKVADDPRYPRRTLYDLEGNSFLEPSRQDYYNAAVLRSTGLLNAPLPEQLKTNLVPVEVYAKYPEDAAWALLGGMADANQQYTRMILSKPSIGTAISADPDRWMILYLVIGLLFAGLTWGCFAVAKRRSR